MFFLCAGAGPPLICAGLVRWCNGSTRVFGALCHGSNPCRTATLAEPKEQSTESRTDSAQLSESSRQKVTCPQIIERGKLWATIYGKSKCGEPKKDGSLTRPYPFYRMTITVAGKRVMRSFATFGAAKAAAKAKLKELANGSQAAALATRPGGSIRRPPQV